MIVVTALKAAARNSNTDIIAESIRQIGGGQVDQETRMVRAALIDVYVERKGAEAGDAIMDEIGL